MNEDRAKAWVKDKVNQQKVIATRVGKNPRADKLAFFMAGIPGAGKTELAKGLQGSPSGDFISDYSLCSSRHCERLEAYSRPRTRKKTCN